MYPNYLIICTQNLLYKLTIESNVIRNTLIGLVQLCSITINKQRDKLKWLIIFGFEYCFYVLFKEVFIGAQGLTSYFTAESEHKIQ